MDYKVLPLFKSAYSFKSILNFEVDDEERDEFAPDSIVEICDSEGLDHMFLVEDNMSSIIYAKKACTKKNIKFSFGLRLSVCSDATNQNTDSERSTSKIVIFCKNDHGYQLLLKISSLASTEFLFNGAPRIDYKHLAELWDDSSLLLAIPFYDSFIFNNAFGFGRCIPDHSFAKPVVFVEDNSLFFDGLLRSKAYQYAEKHGLEVIRTKSIYYRNRSDFMTWQAYMSIQNRSSLEAPNMSHCSSNEFCFEAWREANRDDMYANKPQCKFGFNVSIKNKSDFLGVCFDFEAENLNLHTAKPFQLSLVTFDWHGVKEEFDYYVHWDNFNISKDAERITRFDMDDWSARSQPASVVFRHANKLFEEADVVVGHNIIGYDIHVYTNACKALGLNRVPIELKLIDTFPFLKGHKLSLPYNSAEDSLIGYQMRMYDYLPSEAKKRGFATLKALCDLFDVPTDPNKLHNALEDVKYNVKGFLEFAKHLDI